MRPCCFGNGNICHFGKSIQLFKYMDRLVISCTTGSKFNQTFSVMDHGKGYYLTVVLYSLFGLSFKLRNLFYSLVVYC